MTIGSQSGAQDRPIFPRGRRGGLLVRDILELNQERLVAAIAAFNVERDARQAATTDKNWVRAAEAHAENAERFLKGSQFDAAWSALKAANRELIKTYGNCELRIEADRVYQEGAQKLSGWRAQAVEGILSADWGRLDDATRLRTRVEGAIKADEGKGSGGEATLRARVTTALADAQPRDASKELEELLCRVSVARGILDEHEDNVHRKLALLRGHQNKAGFILAIVLVFTIGVIVATLLSGWRPADDTFMVTDWVSFPIVAVLGSLGAALSGILTFLAADTQQRIPDIRAQRHLVWLRPPIGAAAAIIVVTMLRSGVGGLDVTPRLAYAVAIAAGFSERLVSSAVAAASAAIAK